MPLEKKTFAGGGMDMDTDERFMAKNDYKKAVNCRIAKSDEGNDGIVENIRSNEIIPNTNLGSQTDKVIGAFEDLDNGVIIYFVCDGGGTGTGHAIYRYNPKDDTVSVILKDPILNFHKDHLVTGVNIVGSDEEMFPAGLLYWTDDFNPPRKLNIYKAIEFSAGSANGYVGPITNSILDAIKWPPTLQPGTRNEDLVAAGTGSSMPNFLTDTSVNSNQLKGESWQFKYRWIYDDLEKSAWSPISQVVTDNSWESFFGTSGDKSFTNNVLCVGFLPGNEPVERIQIAARRTNGLDDFFIICDIDKFNVKEKVSTSRSTLGGYLSTLPDTTASWYYYHFYNDGIYATIDVVESQKLYDDVPHLSKAQEVVDGNRIVYGNVVTGQTGIDNIEMEFIPTHPTTSLVAGSLGDPLVAPAEWRGFARLFDYGSPDDCGTDTWLHRPEFQVRFKIPEPTSPTCVVRYKLKVVNIKGIHMIRKDDNYWLGGGFLTNIHQDAAMMIFNVDYTSSSYSGQGAASIAMDIANDIAQQTSDWSVKPINTAGGWRANGGGGYKGSTHSSGTPAWSTYSSGGNEYVVLSVKCSPSSKCYHTDEEDWSLANHNCNVRHAEGASFSNCNWDYTQGNNGTDWSGIYSTCWTTGSLRAEGWSNTNWSCQTATVFGLAPVTFYVGMGTDNTKWYGKINSSGTEVEFGLIPQSFHPFNYVGAKIFDVNSGDQVLAKEVYDAHAAGEDGGFSGGTEVCPDTTLPPPIITSFKSGARHRFGIVYYDRGNRSCAVQLPENNDVYIPRVNETTIDAAGYIGEWEIKWKIHHYPPDWADYYQLVYGGNTLTDKFIQFVTGGIYGGDNFCKLTEIKNILPYSIRYTGSVLVDITNIRRYDERYGGGVVKYDWQEGDVLRFISDENNDPAINAQWEFKIIGVVGRGENKALDTTDKKKDADGQSHNHPFGTAIGGEENRDYLILANESTLLNLNTANGDDFTWDTSTDPDPIFDNYTLEIYTPKKTVEEDKVIYNEFGVFGNCIPDGGSPTGKKHGRILMDTSSSNQTIGGFVNGTLRRGDTYWKTRTTNSDKFLTPVESFHFTDAFKSDYWDKGRPNAVLEDFRRNRKHSTCLYSDPYIPNTNINGLNSIYPDVTFAEYERSYNSIQKLYSKDNNLIIFQEDKVSKALVKRDVIYNVDGSGNVATSDTVLSQAVPYLGKYGINKNPESFAANGNRMYFVDIKRGSVLRLSQDGFTPISDYKMRDYFTDKATKIYKHTTVDNRFNIYGVYDIRFNEYIISFEESEGCPPGSLGPTWDCISGVCVKYCDDRGAFNWASLCVTACPPLDDGGNGPASMAPPPSATGDVGRITSYNRKYQIESQERDKLKEDIREGTSPSITSDTTESSATTSSDTSTTY